MGTDKNIKLHIVTDIKNYQVVISTNKQIKMAETKETPTVVTSVEQKEKSVVENEHESKTNEESKPEENVNGHTHEDKPEENGNGHTNVDKVKEDNGHTEDKVKEDNGHTEDKEENPLKRKEISDIKESPKKKKIDADEKQPEPIVG